jgi:large repetitive protein
MKVLTPALGLFFMSMFVFNNSMAQKASFTSPGGMTIGFGGGYAYQKSDLPNSNGFGFDFTIGSQLYHKENAFLGVDWKFRFLAGVNKAYDHRMNPDNTYSNIRYSFFNYDLELGLTLNRLRERTGIVITGFAGAGITHGRTFTDFYDAGDNLYDFGSIDPNRDSKLVYNDLVALSDGEFETHLVNKASLLPTAGLFIGYQLSRSLTLGIEYKTSFYLTEENSFAGINLDNKVISGSGIDRNNYVSLGFRWNLRGGYSSNNTTENYSTGVTYRNNNTTGTGQHMVAVTSPRPSVNITDPSSDAYHTASPAYNLRATINNVSGADNISFYQNGFPKNNFTYNVNTKTFVANVRLRNGENLFRIEASNQASKAEDQVTITLENPRESVKSAPLVEFTSPSGNRTNSSSERINVTACIQNISSKEDIQLTMNGHNIRFDFFPASGLVKSSVMLQEGNNNLFIKGINDSGSSQDQTTVYFNHNDLMALPSVRYIHPVVPMEVVNNLFPLSAQTQNVYGRNDITVSLNGNRIRNFSFDTNGKVSASLFLRQGINLLEITASNEAGYATESTSITYREPVYIEPVYQEPVHQDPVNRDPANNDRDVRDPGNRDRDVRDPANNDRDVRDPGNRDPGNRPTVTRMTAPVVNILSPAANPFRTNEKAVELRASVLNVASKDNITVQVNGSGTRDFNFSSSTKILTAIVSLRNGENQLIIRAQNEKGSDSKEQLLLKENRPCPQPVIRLIDPDRYQSNTSQQTYTVKAEVRNITNSNQLRLTANGKPVTFNFSNQVLSTVLPLTTGPNNLALIAGNECGEDQVAATVNYIPTVVIEPCTPPTVAFTISEVTRNDASHELMGSVSGVKNKSGISLTLDGRAHSGFQFVPATGDLNAKFKLTPGSHTIVVSVNNECGSDSSSGNVTVEEEKEEESCGIRINPGNADWQFCLVTPSGSFSRENLTNSNFSYSGPASSIYFMPIGGGGNATVNGKSYAVKSGQYYLFTGNLQVTVSTTNPGSMGHWSVCISSSRAPVSGNGNNRPKSPCEVAHTGRMNGNGNRR